MIDGVIMPTNVRIIHARDFIKATPEGALDLAETTKVLKEIATASAHLADYAIILDTRHAHSTMSVTDLWFMAKEISGLGKAFQRKTAVLCPLERFEYAEFLELRAKNRGNQVRALTSLGHAMEWLIEDGPSEEKV